MNKILRNVFLVAVMLIANASFATAYKSLTFPDANKESNKKGNYTSEWTAKIGDDSWTITNFNNNSWNNWTYIKCGSKSAATIANINTDFAIDQPISTVLVSIDKLTADYLNSITLTVSTDKAGTDVVESVSVKELKAGGDITFEISEPKAGYYYQLAFDCAKAKSNGVVQVSKVEYYKQGDTPEIVDISNTPETAYTVAQAKELIAAGKGLATSVYVGGTISSIKEIDTTGQYGNATYSISEDGTTTSELVVFRGYYLKNEKFTSEDQIKVGDVVIVYGQLTSYNGTDEVNSGNYLYAIKSDPTSISSLSADEAVADAPAYNLAGQKVTGAYKDVVVKGGKKFVQK